MPKQIGAPGPYATTATTFCNICNRPLRKRDLRSWSWRAVGCRHLFGLCCGSDMLRVCQVFAGRVQIKAACSRALCCTLGVPILSHDLCAIPLLSLFRSDVLATVRAYAVTAGAR